MPAYVIAEVEVLDAEQYEVYKRLVPPTIAAHGGRYLARGGAVETLEGEWRPRRVVILEFPSLAEATGWWRSVEYAEAKALRQAITHTRMIAVEGL